MFGDFDEREGGKEGSVREREAKKGLVEEESEGDIALDVQARQLNAVRTR